jgi:hypothetical protein
MLNRTLARIIRLLECLVKFRQANMLQTGNRIKCGRFHYSGLCRQVHPAWLGLMSTHTSTANRFVMFELMCNELGPLQSKNQHNQSQVFSLRQSILFSLTLEN